MFACAPRVSAGPTPVWGAGRPRRWRSCTAASCFLLYLCADATSLTRLPAATRRGAARHLWVVELLPLQRPPPATGHTGGGCCRLLLLREHTSQVLHQALRCCSGGCWRLLSRLPGSPACGPVWVPAAAKILARAAARPCLRSLRGRRGGGGLHRHTFSARASAGARCRGRPGLTECDAVGESQTRCSWCVAVNALHMRITRTGRLRFLGLGGLRVCS